MIREISSSGYLRKRFPADINEVSSISNQVPTGEIEEIENTEGVLSANNQRAKAKMP